MKRPKAHQLIPTLIMTAGAAIPMVSAAEILAHATDHGSAGALTAAKVALPSATPMATRTATARSQAPKSTSTVPAATPTPVVTTRTVAGPAVQEQHGVVQATLTIKGKKNVDVQVATSSGEPRSDEINAQAVPLLKSETLTAQSANVNVISGATETSDAYIQSLQSAVASAGLG